MSERATRTKARQLAAVLDDLGRRVEAAAQRRAARWASAAPGTLRDLGVALYADGYLDEAVEMYRRCLALAPDDARARHLLAAATGQGTPARASDEFVRCEFDHLAARFDAKLAALDYRGPALVAEAVAAIADKLPANPAVLDAGCGTGLCAPLLRRYAATLTGVDLSPAMVARADQRGGYDDLVVGELTAHLRAHPRAYALVVSADTLVYFGDLAPVVTAAAAALVPGGFFIFTLERVRSADAPAGFVLQPHGRYSHTRGHVSARLRAAGFRATILRAMSSRKEAGVPVPGWLVTSQLGRRRGRV